MLEEIKGKIAIVVRETEPCRVLSVPRAWGIGFDLERGQAELCSLRRGVCEVGRA